MISSRLDAAILGNTQDGLIRSLIQKYRPGLAYVTNVVTDEGDYYGEWDKDKGLIFTTECDCLGVEEMKFVVLHEIAHAFTGGGHHDNFYGALTALVLAEKIAWQTAIKVEQIIPRLWEQYSPLRAMSS